MASWNLSVNGEASTVEAEPEMPLLWVLRDLLGLTGTKFGCGVGLCGACTIHVDGKAVRSCMIPISAGEGKSITTIEGLSEDGKASSAAGVARRSGATMRILPARKDHDGRGTPR